MAARTRRILIIVVLALATYLGWSRLNRTVFPAFPTGEMRIGVDASALPFALAGKNGLAGIDIDLGYALAGELNVPVRFVNMSIDSLYDSILSNQTDLIISSLPVEPWRMGEIRYTGPYFNAGLVLVSDSTIINMHDVPGHSLAYEFASSADTQVRRWSRLIAEFEQRPYQRATHALDAVRIGEANAALVDAISALLYLQDHPDWSPNLNYVTDNEFAIAVYLHRGETFEYIDYALQAVQESGKLDAILIHWLGRLP